MAVHENTTHIELTQYLHQLWNRILGTYLVPGMFDFSAFANEK